MTTPNQNLDDLAVLLKNYYAATPAPQFAAGLLEQLAAELPARRMGWRPMRWVALAASLAVVCAIGATLSWRNRPADQPLASDTHATLPAVTQGSTGSSVTLGRLGLADIVGRVPLIVRVRLTRWDPPFAQYTVSYVIYGDCPDKTITLDLSGEFEAERRSANDPAEPAVMANFIKTMGLDPDRESILELRPFPKHPQAARGVKYMRLGSGYDAPPQFPLNDYEDKIVATIADGSAFEPHVQPGDILMERIADAQLIVRAEIVQVAAGQSTWKITRVLKGEAKSETLILDDQFFRQRAQAITAHGARKQSGLATTRSTASASSQPAASQPDAALVDAETARLIKAELIASKEAILFIDQVQTKPGSLHGRLRHRAYDDDPKRKLDELQKVIQSGHSPTNL